MTEFSKLKDMDRRPLKCLIGFVILFLYSIGALLMLWCYYNAIRGSIPCIILSLVQITLQMVSRKSRWYINLHKWSDLELYFENFTFVSETEIKDNSRCLFGVHPHGVFSFGMFMNNHRDHFGQNAVVCGSRIVLLTPIMGLLHKLGGMVSVDSSSLHNIMPNGTNIALLPGGFEEATITTKKENRVFIKERKGFVKYAMKYGYSIYPTYIFGENQLYHTFDHFTTFRLFLNKLKIASVLFCSRFILFPEYLVGIHTVVGKPIQVPHIKHPSDQEINHYHQVYMQSIQSLYDKYSEIYNVKQDLKLF